MQSEYEVAWGDVTNGLPTGQATTANSFRTAWNTTIYPLTNGNFVVASPGWNAVTLGSGTAGLTGVPSAANSLVGSSSSDNVGAGGITELTNGNFVVSSPYWDNAGQADAGAVTWVDGVNGLAASISSSNSLVGVTKDDHVGQVYALAYGNYVVASEDWDDWTTATPGVGAVTWGNGNQPGGTKGIISPANSLIGVQYDFAAGSRGVKPLINGNYVVESCYYNHSDPCAATWADGSKPLVGVIGSANSLIGANSSTSVTPLANGNFVFADAHWVNPGWISNDDNPPQIKARAVGAVMLVDGLVGAVGRIDPARSLLGNGYGSPAYTGGTMEGVTALDDGNYVVCDSSFQVDGKAATPKQVGALTWGDGINGTVGVISDLNSVVGASAYDNACYMGSYPYRSVIPLPDGDYFVRSPQWSNGGATKAGAVTWIAGGGTKSETITSSNSIVGTTINEMVGSNANPLVKLGNSDYVMSNAKWTDGGTIPGAGSVTVVRGLGGSVGEVSAQNSLVGTSVNDGVSSGGVVPLGGAYYLIRSPFWHDAAGVALGAMTLGSAELDLAGPLPLDLTVVGTVANQGATMTYDFDESAGRLAVGQPLANRVTLLTVGGTALLRDGFE